MRKRRLSLVDRLITEADSVMRTITDRGHSAGRPSPSEGHSDTELSERERRHVAGLMRVNHTGEVCAQALYQGQALTAKLPTVREEMQQAAADGRTLPAEVPFEHRAPGVVGRHRLAVPSAGEAF